MDFYFLDKRELKRDEISGKAMQLVREFIYNAFRDNKKIEMKNYVANYTELKRLERSCPAIIPVDNLASNYESPPSEIKLDIEPPVTSKKDVIVRMLKEGYSSRHIEDKYNWSYRLIETYRCTYTDIRINDTAKEKKYMTCQLCGKVKEVYGSRVRAKYCSKECRYKVFVAARKARYAKK